MYKIIRPEIVIPISMLAFTVGIVASCATKQIAWISVSFSFCGVMGTLLAGREILRKGLKKYIYDFTHIDYGHFTPTDEEIVERTQENVDIQAKAWGFILLFCSALGLFLVEIIRNLWILK